MKRLYRSTTDKKLGGVCGGLGEYMNADTNLIRLVFVLLLLVTGFVPFGLTYIVAWIILPEDTIAKEEQSEKSKPKPKTKATAGSTGRTRTPKK
jgi:phage shock protein C